MKDAKPTPDQGFRNASSSYIVALLFILLGLGSSSQAIDDTNTTANPMIIDGTNGVPSETPVDTPYVDITTGMPALTNLSVYSETPALPLPGSIQLPASPDLKTNFQALADNNTAIPPDTHGAVGTNHIFTMLNTEYRIQTLGGSNVVSGTLSNFWSPIWPFNIQVFDPRVVYDTINQRWICTALAGPRTVNSFLLVAVSGDSSPTNGFYYARYKADANSVAWADYPSVGLNQQWFVIHVNMFAISDNALLRSQIYVFNRTNWYAGGGASPTLLAHTNTSTANPTAGLETPAITYDTNVTAIYLVQNVITNSNRRVRLFSITGCGKLADAQYQPTLPRS